MLTYRRAAPASPATGQPAPHHSEPTPCRQQPHAAQPSARPCTAATDSHRPLRCLRQHRSPNRTRAPPPQQRWMSYPADGARPSAHSFARSYDARECHSRPALRGRLLPESVRPPQPWVTSPPPTPIARVRRPEARDHAAHERHRLSTSAALRPSPSRSTATRAIKRLQQSSTSIRAAGVVTTPGTKADPIVHPAPTWRIAIAPVSS